MSEKPLSKPEPIPDGRDYFAGPNDGSDADHEIGRFMIDTADPAILREQKAAEVARQLADALKAKEATVTEYMNRGKDQPPFGTVGIDVAPDPNAKLYNDKTGLHSSL